MFCELTCASTVTDNRPGLNLLGLPLRILFGRLFVAASVFAGCASGDEARRRLSTFRPGLAAREWGTEQLRLVVGESAFVSVRWFCKAERSQIQVQAGEVYDFRVPPGARWVDLVFHTGPEGYSNAYMSLLSRTKRVSGAPWFALCGRVGEDDRNAFIIGRELVGHAMTESGELAFFANGNRHFYWNNFGAIPLLITRVR
jgi:hypothetical protein